MTTKDDFWRSASRALLYNVTANMRLVAGRYLGDTADLLFVFDQPPTENEEELALDVGAETRGDFEEAVDIKVTMTVDQRPRRTILDEVGPQFSTLYARYEHPDVEWGPEPPPEF